VPATSDQTIINNSGTALLGIGDAGHCRYLYLGSSAPPESDGNVDVAGGSLDIAHTLYCGTSDESGALNITNGGTVTGFVSHIDCGGDPVSARVSVEGTHSTWTTSGYIAVGNYGWGALDVANGGTVESTQDVRIGYYATANGHDPWANLGPVGQPIQRGHLRDSVAGGQ
jgi:T5SS/PEP-CTERM-associated repeat protein